MRALATEEPAVFRARRLGALKAAGGTAAGVAAASKAAKRMARALAFLVPLIALMKSPDKLVMRKGIADWAEFRQLQVRECGGGGVAGLRTPFEGVFCTAPCVPCPTWPHL